MSNACKSPEEAVAIAEWWKTRYPLVDVRVQGLYVSASGHCLNEEDLSEARREIEQLRAPDPDFVPDSFYEQLARTLSVDLQHLSTPFWLVLDLKRVVASGPSIEWLRGWRECAVPLSATRGKERARYVIIDGKRLVDMVRA